MIFIRLEFITAKFLFFFLKKPLNSENLKAMIVYLNTMYLISKFILNWILFLQFWKGLWWGNSTKKLLKLISQKYNSYFLQVTIFVTHVINHYNVVVVMQLYHLSYYNMSRSYVVNSWGWGYCVEIHTPISMVYPWQREGVRVSWTYYQCIQPTDLRAVGGNIVFESLHMTCS